MEMKDTLYSSSDSEEQEIQQLQNHAKILKENSLNKLNPLQTTIQHLSSSNYSMYNKFRDSFHRLFEADERTFKSVLSRNLERQLNKETLHEKNSNSDLRAIKVQLTSSYIQKYKDCNRIVLDKGNDQGLKNQSNTSGDESSRSRNECNDKALLGMTDQNAEDECDALANLIANLKLDVDENKKIQNQLKKANVSLTQELKECKSTLAETSRTLEESNSIRDSCLIALQNKQTEFERNSPKHVSFQTPRESKKDTQSYKTTKRYMPVEKKCDLKKHDRQIPIGQKFSPNKSSNVYLKTMPPRSGLTWKPTGRIFTQVGLKWIPIRNPVESRYNTNDSASPLGKKTHNPNTTIYTNSSSLSAVSAGRYVVPTGRVIVPTGRYVVPTGRVIVATGRYVVPADKYEVWAMKMEYWITNNDMIIWKVIQHGNNMKRNRRDRDGRVIILLPTTADEHITIQRESKARTTLLQSIPDDHVADFHYMDDARDIWNAVKARFGGNTESKKIRKSMLKQEFPEFIIIKAERLHKGYDRMQKILSQLNQLKAKPEDEDINLKFLRALLSSWSHVALTLKTKGGLELLSFDDLYYKLKTLEKAGRKIDFDKKESARFKKKKVRCYKCQQRGHFARKCRANGGNDKQRYSSFKIKKIGKKEEDSKALITVDTLVDWTDHDDEGDEVITAKEFGMIAGCDSEDAIKEVVAKIYNVITGTHTEEATTVGDAEELALMGVTSEGTKLGWDDSAFSVFTTNSKDVEGRHIFHRFAKTDSMKAVPPPLTRDYTSLLDHTNLDESQMTYGKKSSISCDPKYVPNDFVSCDNSDKSSEGNTNDFAFGDSGVKSSEHKPTDSTSCASISSVSTYVNEAEIESNNEHTSRTSCNKNGYFNNKAGHFRKHASSVSKLCFVCGSGTHLIKDCDFYEKQMANTTVGIRVGPPVRPQPVPTGKPKVKPVPTGKPQVKPVPTSKPKVTPVSTGKPHVSTPVPTGKPKVTPVSTGKPHVSTPVPTSRTNRPFPVPTNRGYSPSVISGLYGQLLLSPQQVVLGKHIDKETSFSATKDERIFDSGCSRSMTGNKKRLDDFQAFHGRKVTFGGGEGRITKKGTIHTESLVLSKDFKLPNDSMVVLKFSRKHNLYIINLNDLCPRGNLACLVAHASFDEFVKWHRRMAHVNYKNMNRLVKKNLVRGLPPKLFKNDHTCVACCKVRTACYVLNRVSVTSPHNKTPYALLTDNIPFVSHFKPFGYHVTILNTSDHLGKFDGKADEGYIVGYSASNIAYRVYNVPNKRVEESMDLRFLKEKPNLTNSADTPGDKVDDSSFPSVDEIFQKEFARLKDEERRGTSYTDSPALGTANNAEDLQTPLSDQPVPTGNVPVLLFIRLNRSSSSTDSIFDGEPTTRFPCLSDLGNHNPSPCLFSSSSYDDEFDTTLNNVASSMEVSPGATKRINTIHPQSLIIEDPTTAMQTQNKILKNKRESRGIVVRNKARLVAQGHRQEESIGYDEVFTPVAQIEAIRLFLAFTSYMGFLVYQIDVKSALLYGRIDEEVYVTQPKGFVDPQHPKKVYKAWCDEFEALVKGEFQMSAMGELTFFLGLQVQQRPDGIFIHQDKYVHAILKKFDLESVRTATTPYEAPKPKSKNEYDNPVNVHLYRSMIGSLMYLTTSRPDIMFAVSACLRHQVTPTTSNLEAVKKIFKYLKGQPKLGLWYPKEPPFVLEAYSDSDYARANKDRKSTTGGCVPFGIARVSTGSVVFPTG
uniref:Ribonuclease H-like domain, reverse transcriptase, RNA-dependent DNA polymerase n=1 Tax=Tanacetum cinerariifolium TaxID=118510 RepID=A0A6L2N368_TANCI|nr:ribonuclease H-like domain, reverse transcriptase, RNA-dependent DNA polymerase [Tanacetum cinerariifolium]